MLVQAAADSADLPRPARRVAVTPCLRVFVADPTLKRRPDPSLAALRGEDPDTLLPGRPVANVLAMTAREDGDPIPHVVLLESGNGSFHGQRSSGSGSGSSATSGWPAAPRTPPFVKAARRSVRTRSAWRSSSRSF